MRPPTVINPKDVPTSQRWSRYRLVRLAFWTTLFLAGVMTPTWYLPLFVGVTLLAVFWPCPRCGKRVGIFSALYVFHLPWPFGGMCMTCFQPLLRKPKDG